MAEGKNKIVFYRDWQDSFQHLTDEEAGILIKHFFAYVNDENPILQDRLLIASWIPIEKTLKRDLNKWKQYVDKQRLNGSKGGRPKNPKNPTVILGNPNKPKKAVNVSVSVNDNIYKEKNFLEDWSKCRKHYLKKPTHIKKLDFNELNNFKNILVSYTSEEIKKALHGLFKQQNKNISSMYLKPKHFLENFDKYYNAELSKDYSLYGTQTQKSEL